MAGGRETPRQKLIGIMYLILLALLALQVSSAIMEKFKFLDDSLKRANDVTNTSNQIVFKSISSAVKERGYAKNDLEILDKAKKVTQEASKIKLYIDQLRSEIIATTGGYEIPTDPNSMYKGAKEENLIEELMIGKKKGLALKREVNEFCKDLRTITGKKAYIDIALDAKNDPRISNNSEQKQKDFSELNFAQTPMVAAMAVLSNIEGEVLKYEAAALNDLSSLVDASRFKFDQIEATYRAESNTVVAGTKYRAEVFLGASSSSLNPTIIANGQNLKVNVNGKGIFETTAQGGGYVDGFAKRKWQGKITIKQNGKDTTFIVQGEYKVAQPYVDVQTATLPVLYKNCGNELRLSCPPLGADFKPSYEGSTGAKIISGNQVGKVLIVPSSPQVKLKISSNGNYLDEKTYQVLLVPSPTVKVYNGSQEVDPKLGLKAPFPPRLRVVAEPDGNFAKLNSRDARYNIAQIEVSVIRRRSKKYSAMFNSGNLDLSFLNSAGIIDGDILLIDVQKIQRANFENVVEDLKLNVVKPISLTK